MTNEQLVEQIQGGFSVTDNMQTLYQNNVPLIRQIIKPYSAYEQIEDLMQEAYFGLVEAVKHYKASENVLFMSYAKFWIMAAVQKYIDACGSVLKIPSCEKQKIIRYKRTVRMLLQEYGRIPTDEEVATYMFISISELSDIKRYSQSVSSLDEQLNFDTEETVGNCLKSDICVENETIDKMYNEYAKSELWGIVERYTSTKENEVICSRFIDKDSLQKIADRNGISKNRVRQLEASALNKLRCGKAKKELQEKFEVFESKLYRNSVRTFKERDFTSTVEYIAMRKYEMMRRYEDLCKRYGVGV